MVYIAFSYKISFSFYTWSTSSLCKHHIDNYFSDKIFNSYSWFILVFPIWYSKIIILGGSYLLHFSESGALDLVKKHFFSFFLSSFPPLSLIPHKTWPLCTSMLDSTSPAPSSHSLNYSHSLLTHTKHTHIHTLNHTMTRLLSKYTPPHKQKNSFFLLILHIMPTTYIKKHGMGLTFFQTSTQTHTTQKVSLCLPAPSVHPLCHCSHCPAVHSHSHSSVWLPASDEVPQPLALAVKKVINDFFFI